MGSKLPPLALSVRQPWAWAIIHGGKVIENRSAGAIRAGGMDCRRIAIHAASAMTEEEYRWGLWRLERHGVRCPAPGDLVRGGIIGAVDVEEIITESDSDWFGGPCGLVLENPEAVDPVPAKGALGYFRWERADGFASVKPWMARYGGVNGDGATGMLFDDLAPAFREVPKKPWSR